MQTVTQPGLIGGDVVFTSTYDSGSVPATAVESTVTIHGAVFIAQPKHATVLVLPSNLDSLLAAVRHAIFMRDAE